MASVICLIFIWYFQLSAAHRPKISGRLWLRLGFLEKNGSSMTMHLILTVPLTISMSWHVMIHDPCSGWFLIGFILFWNVFLLTSYMSSLDPSSNFVCFWLWSVWWVSNFFLRTPSKMSQGSVAIGETRTLRHAKRHAVDTVAAS